MFSPVAVRSDGGNNVRLLSTSDRRLSYQHRRRICTRLSVCPWCEY